MSSPCWGSWGSRTPCENSFETVSSLPDRAHAVSSCLILHGLQDAWASQGMVVTLLTWQLAYPRANFPGGPSGSFQASFELRSKFENILSAAFFWTNKSTKADQVLGEWN